MGKGIVRLLSRCTDATENYHGDNNVDKIRHEASRERIAEIL